MKKRVESIVRRARRIKLGRRVLSMFLTLVLLFLFIPATVYAEAAEAISSLGDGADEETILEDSGTDSKKTPIYTYEGVSYEETSLREANVKHFRLEDGSYVAADYGTPVHIYDEEKDEWLDIDNTLYDISGMYASSDSRIKFEKKITGSETLYTLKDGNTKITLSLTGAKKGVVGVVANGEDAEEDTQLQKLMNLEKLSSSVLYQDILDGVDIEYVVNALSIKENIIVKERQDSYTYTFTLKLNGLSAELSDNGDILLYEKESENAKYVIPAPVVYDANGVYAPEGVSNYSLVDNGNGKYTLSVFADASWMNDDERAYPVTVDPMVRRNNSASTPFYVVSADSPNSSAVASATMTLSPTQKGFAYYSYSGHLRYDYITSVEMYFYGQAVGYSQSNQVSGYVSANASAYYWSNQLSWNQIHEGEYKYSDIPMDYRKIDSVGWYSFDITKTVLYHANDDHFSTAVVFALISGDTVQFTAGDSTKPYTVTTYRHMTGLEDYWATSSHSVGAAGTGTVNLANGNLTFEIPLLSTTDSLMPYTVTAVHNHSTAYNEDRNGYMPGGYMLNIGETVAKRTYGSMAGVNESYYVHTDEDGTEHAYFVSNEDTSVYIDEDGLQKSLRIYDNYITITDDNTKEVKTFTKKNSTSWYLTSIADIIGNKITITYDTANDRPTALNLVPFEMSSINMLSFAYNSDGILSAVYNPVTKDAAVFRVSSSYGSGSNGSGYYYLRQMDFCVAQSSVTGADFVSFSQNSASSTGITVVSSGMYTYDYSGLLMSAEDVNGNYRVDYTVGHEPQRAKVYRIKEYDTSDGDTLGNEIRLYISRNSTSVTTYREDSLENIQTTYTFDKMGRCVSTYSIGVESGIVYGGALGEYQEQENVKNRIKSSITLGGDSVNYLTNSDFSKENADGTPMYWQITGDTALVEGEYRHKRISIPTDSSLSQYVYLPNGTYTLSIPHISFFEDDDIATVTVKSITQNTVLYEKVLAKVTYSSLSANFNVENTSTNGDVVLVKISTNYAHVYFDRIMLERNSGASMASILNFGSFENSLVNSNGTAIATPGDFWKTETGSSNISIVNDSLAITGDLLKANNYVKQRVYEAPAKKISNYDTKANKEENLIGEYIISGFITAPNGYFIHEDQKIGFRVDIAFYQGAGNEDIVETLFFETSDTGKTFVTGFVPIFSYYQNNTDSTKDYNFVKYIDVSCVYENQINGTVAYFDNISFAETNIDNMNHTYYNEAGLPAINVIGIFEEYYYYNENRTIEIIANNKEQATEYWYDENQPLLVSNVNDFAYDMSSSSLEKNYTNVYSFIKTQLGMVSNKIYPKSRMLYSYNEFGLTVSIINVPGGAYIDDGIIEATYSYHTNEGCRIFGALYYECSDVGTGTRYFYDNTDGRLLATIDAIDNKGYAYVYDSSKRLQNVYPTTYNSSSDSLNNITTAESVTYTYDSNNYLTAITTPSTQYSFSYGLFGNTEAVSIGSAQVVSYEYYENNGNVKKVIYSNGHSVEYIYNSLELVSEVWYNSIDSEGISASTKAYEYEYTTSGTLYKFIDNISGKSTLYEYDITGKLIGIDVIKNADYTEYMSVDMWYTNKEQLLGTSYHIPFVDYYDEECYYYGSNTNTYNIDGSLKQYKTNAELSYFYEKYGHSSATIEYEYDAFKRVSKTNTSYYNHCDTGTSFSVENSYEYRIVNSNNFPYTDNLVSSYTSTLIKDSGTTTRTYTYTYDSKGYITQIGDSIRYFYDDIGQLVEVWDGPRQRIYKYSYDNAGNITSAKTYTMESFGVEGRLTSNNAYTYSTGAWGDQLTAYNGNAITYDSIGNPLSYYNGMAFTWQGRQMSTAYNQQSDTLYTFTYDDNGIRQSKLDGRGRETLYFYDGNLLIAERSTLGMVVYMYDNMNSPIGFNVVLFKSYNKAEAEGRTYWYKKNMQGEIIGLYSATGQEVATYLYDPYGNIISKNIITSEINYADYNRLFYRGYYYDTDLGLYYLGARYYDANIGRFISPDAIDVVNATPMALTDKNLYAYCDNNPIMRVDNGGEFWNIVVGAAIGAIVNFTVATIPALLDDGQIDDTEWKKIGVSTVLGAAEGALTAICPGASIAISAASSATEAAINGIIEGQDFQTIAVNTIVSGAIGAVGGAGTPNFVKGGKLINEAVSSVGKAVKNGVHPAVKKAARKVIGKAIKKVSRSAFSSLVEEFAYSGISDFSSWYMNTAINRAFGR